MQTQIIGIFPRGAAPSIAGSSNFEREHGAEQIPHRQAHGRCGVLCVWRHETRNKLLLLLLANKLKVATLFQIRNGGNQTA